MNIKQILEEKQEWRDYKARIKALPQPYQIVYKEMEKYLFRLCCTEGILYDTILSGVLELFEEGAAVGKDVLEITGTDVAAFCDGLL